MVRVRVRLGYTVAICLVLQHLVSPHYYWNFRGSHVQEVSKDCFDAFFVCFGEV